MDMVAKILGGIVGTFILAVLFKPLFGSKEEFFECLKYWLKPDFLSWMNGEGMEDWISEVKLGIWLFLGVGSGIFTAVYLGKLFA